MQDRPDLVQSELAGLAFDSLQQVFRKQDILMMFETEPLALTMSPTIWLVIDPAAGGPQSDYAVVSMCRVKGCVVVRRVWCVLRAVCGASCVVRAACGACCVRVCCVLVCCEAARHEMT